MLFQMDAEEAHRAVLDTLHRWPRLTTAMLSALVPAAPGGLTTQIGPLRVPSPIGLAAGLDKDGEAIRTWPALGFGFVEVGTVTPKPQAGNPKPRMFRLVPERALINRMGFNNAGLQALRTNLEAHRRSGLWSHVPIGANIGKNKTTPNDAADDDYLACVAGLRGLADWFTVNVSSPNTPGLRDLQAPERLSRLLGVVVGTADGTPVFLKLAPDLEPTALAEAVEVAMEAGCTGIIATNTTISRPDETGRTAEGGGLSGAPLWPLAQERIAQVVAAVNGRGPVIGVGGVTSPDRAEALLQAGCAGVQIYSGMIFEGPGLVLQILRHLARAHSAPLSIEAA